jgi:hypothetical protein
VKVAVYLVLGGEREQRSRMVHLIGFMTSGSSLRLQVSVTTIKKTSSLSLLMTFPATNPCWVVFH